MKRFALVGAAGYIAPRHMKAIKETGNELIVAYDPSNSVGIIDSYFPFSEFFTDYDSFQEYLKKINAEKQQLDYLTICSPNHFHEEHIKLGLNQGLNVICEKPIALNPQSIDALQYMEKETGKRVYNIAQLRLHPSVIELKKKIALAPNDKVYDIDLAYITARGKWYKKSWKGDENKSGGIVTNIGIHFFDMLIWIFGAVKKNTLNIKTEDKAAGYLELEQANVRWFLSIDMDDIPQRVKEAGSRTYRSIMIEDQEFEFSQGFNDLHTESYKDILIGNGFLLEEARKAIEVVYDINNKNPINTIETYQYFAKK